jgi:hypothetical protein
MGGQLALVWPPLLYLHTKRQPKRLYSFARSLDLQMDEGGIVI